MWAWGEEAQAMRHFLHPFACFPSVFDPLPPAPTLHHPQRPLLAHMNDVLFNNGHGNTEFANLPRKLNICISATRDDFPHTHVRAAARAVLMLACGAGMRGALGRRREAAWRGCQWVLKHCAHECCVGA